MVNARYKKVILLGALLASLSLGSAMAASYDDIVPAGDWTYESINTLVKHDALTDTKGIKTDGSVQYTRGQLAPLMAYITKEREHMNDTDKEIALKLYQAYKDEVLAYNVAETKREKALAQEKKDHKDLVKKLDKKRTKAEKEAAKADQKAAKEAQKAANKSKKQGVTRPASPAPAVINDVYYGAVNPPAQLQPIAPPDAAQEVTYDNEKPEEVALTPEQIQEKMKHFKVDTSPLQVGGDVRVRTQGTKGGKSKTDGKANVEMAMTW